MESNNFASKSYQIDSPAFNGKVKDYFDVDDLQKIQDLFSSITGVASIITEIDGTPVTTPSGFCALCLAIRKTEIGLKNCLKSDSIIGKSNEDGPTIKRCFSGGLIDAGASIIIDGNHIGNWMIGQIFDSEVSDEELLLYADEIGIERSVFSAKLSKVKRLKKEEFEKISDFLYLNTKQLSKYIKKSIKLSEEIGEQKILQVELKRLNQELDEKNQEIEKFFSISSDLFSITDAAGKFYKANKAWGDILGYSEADLESMKYQEHIHTDDLEDYYNVMIEIEETGKNFGFTPRYRHKDGSYRFIEWSCIKEGEYYYSSDRDVTEKILQEMKSNEIDRRQRIIFEQSPLGMALVDSNTHGIYQANAKFTEIMGRSIEELNAIDWKVITHPSDLEKDVTKWELLKNHKISNYTLEKRYLHPSLHWVWTNLTISLVDSASANSDSHILMLEDISVRKEAEIKLIESQFYLNESQKVANIGSFHFNLEMDHWTASDELIRIFGIDEDYPRNFDGWTAILRSDYKQMFVRYFKQIRNNNRKFDFDYPINRKIDGKEVWVHGLGIFECDSSGKPANLIGTIQDITKRKKTEEELKFFSYHDQLTGLYNRKYYEDELSRIDVNKNLPLSIVMADINGMKVFNDAFGHKSGDKLLKKAAELIQSACEKKYILSRWGGDEFVLILPQTDANAAAEFIDRIKSLLLHEYMNDINLSISFGCDTKKNILEDIQSIQIKAEDNMYKQKMMEGESLRGNAITTIMRTLYEKNPREERHSSRVSELCQAIGKELKLSRIDIQKLKVVGMLHDIGKIAIEESILNKPGSLTKEEFEEIKKHPDIGFRILSSSFEMKELANLTLFHHERWDGKGYPQGLKGEEIPVLSRIISVADSYDAMTSDRPYRRALTKEEAIDQILENLGSQFDPRIAKAFVENIREKCIA